jgi:hypothetical protein
MMVRYGFMFFYGVGFAPAFLFVVFLFIFMVLVVRMPVGRPSVLQLGVVFVPVVL